MKKTGDWIWRDNLVPFLQILASAAAYKFSDGEIAAICAAVDASDSDAQPAHWYECDLSGKHHLAVKLGRDQGTDVVQFQLVLPEAVYEKIEMTLRLLNQYVLRSS